MKAAKYLFKYKCRMKGTVTVQVKIQHVTLIWMKGIIIESPITIPPTYSNCMPRQWWRCDEDVNRVKRTENALSQQFEPRLTTKMKLASWMQ